jgi:hypothetical protein
MVLPRSNSRRRRWCNQVSFAMSSLPILSLHEHDVMADDLANLAYCLPAERLTIIQVSGIQDIQGYRGNMITDFIQDPGIIASPAACSQSSCSMQLEVGTHRHIQKSTSMDPWEPERCCSHGLRLRERLSLYIPHPTEATAPISPTEAGAVTAEAASRSISHPTCLHQSFWQAGAGALHR